MPNSISYEEAANFDEESTNNAHELPLKRTAYMQFVMNETYPQIAIIAIRDGKFDGAWEKAIAAHLFLDCYNDQNPQTFDLLEQTGDTEYTKDTFLKAAYLITKSIAPSYNQNGN